MSYVKTFIRIITVGTQYAGLFILTYTLLYTWMLDSDRITINFNRIGEQLFETVLLTTATVLSIGKFIYWMYRRLK
jgi:hypothetical protein